MKKKLKNFAGDIDSLDEPTGQDPDGTTDLGLLPHQETVAKTVKEYMNANVSDMAESHLECWRDRYATYGGNQRRMWEDLTMNHDPSLEVERVEEDIKRELNSKERYYVVSRFNKAVKVQWLKGYER